MGRSFYLYPNKSGTYLAEILDPQTGARVCFRSTGKKSRDDAVMVVSDWLRDGIPLKKRGRSPRRPGSQTIETVIGLSTILKSIEKTIDLDTAGAQQIAESLRNRGLLDFTTVKAGAGSIDFMGFLERFWDFDRSDYVKEKVSHGYQLSRNTCYENLGRVRLYWKSFFQGRNLASITTSDLTAFSLHLAKPKQLSAEQKKGRRGTERETLAPATIKKIMLPGTIAIKWAFRQNLIVNDPTAGLLGFTLKGKKRGVLSPDEAAALFAASWNEKRSRTGNLVAMTTGMRAGEVLALRKSDIDPVRPVLYIRHSWSKKDGLKSTKTDEERRAALLPVVREALNELLAENPYKDNPDPYVFYSTLQEQPMDDHFLLDGLKDACKLINVDPVARNIVYHSWRHFWVSRMADRMAIDEVARVSGHKTKAMAELYADHLLDEAIEKTAEAGQEVFGKILPFRKVG